MTTHRTWPKWGLTVAAALVLQACGGGGGDKPDTSATPSTDPSTTVAHAQGTVYDASTGQPLSNVTIVVGDKTVSTNEQGQFDVEATAGASLTVKASKADYADGQTTLNMATNGRGAATVISLIKVGAVQTVSGASGGDATLPGTTALVKLPPKAVIDSKGDSFTGDIKVSLTAIDPAAQPRSMPGTYLANDGRLIESFGAIQVRLTDAAGKPLQLALDAKATIRIPLKTRSTEPPAEVPLYYFDESTGRWKQEGSAKLNAAGGYYEGQVAHFSTWNADSPIEQTITVRGCVRDANDKVPKEPVMVATDGLNYSGVANAIMAEDGSFEVRLKRNARARLVAERFIGGSSPEVLLPPSDTDIDKRGECLKLADTPTIPVFKQQPIALGWVIENRSATLLAGAIGAGQLRYQWKLNGQDIPGQNGPMLFLPNVTLADNDDDKKKVYTVVVSNGAGSVTSNELRLLVKPADWMTQLDSFFHIASTVAQASMLPLSPINTVQLGVTRMRPLANICGSGSVTSLTLDTKKVNGGEDLISAKPHTLSVTFDHCAPGEDGDFGSPLTGSIVADFTFFDNGGLSGTATLSNLKEEYDEEGAAAGSIVNGSFGVTWDLSQPDNPSNTVTPGNGASAARFVGGVTSKPLIFTGGKIASSSGEFVYQNVSFTLDGVSYVLNGSYPSQAQPTNQLVLSSGGKQIAIMSLTTGAAQQATPYDLQVPQGRVPTY